MFFEDSSPHWPTPYPEKSISIMTCLLFMYMIMFIIFITKEDKVKPGQYDLKHLLVNLIISQIIQSINICICLSIQIDKETHVYPHIGRYIHVCTCVYIYTCIKNLSY